MSSAGSEKSQLSIAEDELENMIENIGNIETKYNAYRIKTVRKIAAMMERDRTQAWVEGGCRKSFLAKNLFHMNSTSTTPVKEAPKQKVDKKKGKENQPPKTALAKGDKPKGKVTVKSPQQKGTNESADETEVDEYGIEVLDSGLPVNTMSVQAARNRLAEKQ